MKLITYMFAMIAQLVILWGLTFMVDGMVGMVTGSIVIGAVFGIVYKRISDFEEDAQ